MTGRVLSERQVIAVEQMLAFGRSVDYICRHVGCNLEAVAFVIRRLDAINALPPEQPIRRQKVPA